MKKVLSISLISLGMLCSCETKVVMPANEAESKINTNSVDLMIAEPSLKTIK